MSMDVRLLDALNNLSLSLELISEALTEGNSAKSDVAKALSGGDFFKVISEIKIGIDELKENVSEMSVKQDTILELSKENSKKLDVQTDLIKKQSSVLEGMQSDIKNRKSDSPIDTSNSKNQSGLKNGIATILLIAVAVLAIGLAFKLIGGVSFLSVIALSVGIYIISLAFERISKMNITPKKALETSLLMIIMSGAIMVSSWLLAMVAPMSISQVLTSLSIAGLFYFVLPVMVNIMDSMMTPLTLTLPNGTKIKTKVVNVGKLVATAIFLPILMFTMSLGIMIASRVLSGVKALGLGQIITSLLISGMFALAAPALVKVIETIGANKLGFAKLFQISLILPLVLLGISLAIMLSSYVLGLVKPIGLGQAITAILISGMFAVISFGLAKLLNAFSNISPTKALAAAFLIPIVLTAISIAIMLSSWALGLVMPISFSQFLTALGISIIFIAFSFAIKIMSDSISKMGPENAVLLPLLFGSFSVAIMVSSWMLSMVVPISMPQFLTALGISAIFVVLAFSIKLIGDNLSKIDTGSIWKVPLIFTAFSLAIMLSSHILAAAADISAGKILKLLFFSVVLTVSVVLIGLAIWVIKKLKLDSEDLIKGGFAIVIIATTIMLSSLILSLGSYDNYPGLGWAIGVAASLIAFGLGAFAIGMFVTGPQALATLAGLGAIIVIAATITGVSYILSAGKYDNYPNIGWAASVALLVGGFGVAALGLGVAILGTLGLGALAMATGLGAIVGIAETMVEVSEILSTGNWKDGPTTQWSSGVSSALRAFMPIYEMLSDSQDWFFAGPSVEDFSNAIESISTGIVTAANSLALGDIYKNGPTYEWSRGVSSALRAFMPIYQMVSDSQDWFFTGPSVNQFSNAIKSISTGIVTAAKSLALGDDVYKKGPTQEWSSGVSSAIGGFMPVYKMLSDSQDWLFFGPTIYQYVDAIKSISTGIVTAAKSLALGDDVYKKGPTQEWSSGVSSALNGFMPVYKMLSDSQDWLFAGPTIEEFSNAIATIATGIVTAAKSLAVGDEVYKKGPTYEWSKGVSSALSGFMPVYKMLSDSQDWLFAGPTIEEFSNAIATISIGIVTAAKSLAVGDEVYKKGPTYEWSKGVSSALGGFMSVYKILSDSSSWLSSAPTIEEFSNAIASISIGIVTAAKSLAVGDEVYKKGPTYEWSKGVSESIKGFMPVYKILSDSSGWLSSAPTIEEFSNAIATISTGIVTAAKSLAVGDDIYKNGPTYEWSKGVSESIKGFMPVYKILSDSSGWLSSAPTIEQFSVAISTISTGIVTAAKSLSVGDDVYKNGPTYEWAKGVSESIKGFMPVYKMLADSSGWLSSAPTIEEFSNAISTISTGIVTAAKSLAVGDDVYKNGPTYEWAKGVSESIKGFMPVYKMLADSSGLFGSSPDIDEFKKSIISISYGIKKVGSIFSNGKFDNYPKSDWSKGIYNAIKSFRRLLGMNSIFDSMKISNLNRLVKSIVDTSKKISNIKFNNNVNKNLSNMVSSIKKYIHFRNGLKYFGKSSVDLVADDMIKISKKFSINSKYFSNNISPNYMKNIISNISSYLKILKMVEKSQKSGLINNKSFNNKSISNITDGIVKMAKSFDKLSKSLSKFTSSIKGINTDKLNQLNGLTSNIATLSAVDSKSLDKVLKVLESRSSAISKMLDRGDSKSGSNIKKKEGGVNSKIINNRDNKKSPELVKLSVIAQLLYNLNVIFNEGSAFDDFIYKKLGESGAPSSSPAAT